jgi:hypothetical protein
VRRKRATHPRKDVPLLISSETRIAPQPCYSLIVRERLKKMLTDLGSFLEVPCIRDVWMCCGTRRWIGDFYAADV